MGGVGGGMWRGSEFLHWDVDRKAIPLHLYFNRMFKRCTRGYLQMLIPCFPIGISYVWSFFPKWWPPKSFRVYLEFVYIWKAAIVVRKVFSLRSAEFFNFERKKKQNCLLPTLLPELKAFWRNEISSRAEIKISGPRSKCSRQQTASFVEYRKE